MRVKVVHARPEGADVPPCNAASCASNALICAWRSAIVCAFAGVAKANTVANTSPIPTSTAAMFFVVKELLIVLF